MAISRSALNGSFQQVAASLSNSRILGRSSLKYVHASSQVAWHSSLSPMLVDSLKRPPRHVPSFFTQQQHSQVRWYTPLTKEEEETEKQRVKMLSEFTKEQELRQLNRQIAKLEMLRGINTGEWYTMQGKYKYLAREYGSSMVMYYFACWTACLVGCWVVIDMGGVDVVALLHRIDLWTGFDLVNTVRPEWGKAGLAVVLNEVLEVVRLPFVVVTVRPVVDHLFPKQY